MKRQATDWEKIFVNPIYVKIFVNPIYFKIFESDYINNSQKATIKQLYFLQ